MVAAAAVVAAAVFVGSEEGETGDVSLFDVGADVDDAFGSWFPKFKSISSLGLLVVSVSLRLKLGARVLLHNPELVLVALAVV